MEFRVYASFSDGEELALDEFDYKADFDSLDIAKREAERFAKDYKSNKINADWMEEDGSPELKSLTVLYMNYGYYDDLDSGVVAIYDVAKGTWDEEDSVDGAPTIEANDNPPKIGEEHLVNKLTGADYGVIGESQFEKPNGLGHPLHIGDIVVVKDDKTHMIYLDTIIVDPDDGKVAGYETTHEDLMASSVDVVNMVSFNKSFNFTSPDLEIVEM